MKKLFEISLILILIIIPLFANADDTYPPMPGRDDGPFDQEDYPDLDDSDYPDLYLSTIENVAEITNEDRAAAASAAYVKGAYNAALNESAGYAQNAYDQALNISKTLFVTQNDINNAINASTGSVTNVSLNVSGSVTGYIPMPIMINWGDTSSTTKNVSLSDGTISTGATATGSINDIDIVP